MKKQIQYSLILLVVAFLPAFAFSQCNSQDQGGSIKILTWNIYMLPRLYIHTGQVKRAKEIAEILKTQDADIIVFEEAFDNKARGIIREGLKSLYPFESGDPRKNVFYKTSCGVWILSKVPVEIVKQIFFKNAQGSDRFACKGAILLKGMKDGFCFQLVGTHLQSDPNNGKDVQAIRAVQYNQIRKELLEPYAEENVPQFVAGDFNTIEADSNNHSQLVDSLKLNQCTLEGEKCYSYDYGHNDLIVTLANQPQLTRPQLIDYVFYSKPGHLELEGKMHIVTFRKQWDAAHCDLSDHFAVAAEFHFLTDDTRSLTNIKGSK
ncbi:MAG: sphingomyelin phosphodiesterase [Bacteroidia bacterium]